MGHDVSHSHSANPQGHSLSESDDAETEQNQATVTGIRRVTVFPHVLDGATLCNVSVTTRVAHGRATAAVFTPQSD